ncbi:MAG: transposase [Saprospiraceae bacterium]|jgi:transposase
MKGKKTTQKRRRYDAEFKLNVLELHKTGRSVSSLATSFGINENLIYRWKKESKDSESTSQTSEIIEIKALRNQLKEVEQERDILKKALGIFSRHL